MCHFSRRGGRPWTLRRGTRSAVVGLPVSCTLVLTEPVILLLSTVNIVNTLGKGVDVIVIRRWRSVGRRIGRRLVNGSFAKYWKVFENQPRVSNRYHERWNHGYVTYRNIASKYWRLWFRGPWTEGRPRHYARGKGEGDWGRCCLLLHFGC